MDAFREHDGYEYANTIGQFFVTRYGFDKMIKPTEVNMNIRKVGKQAGRQRYQCVKCNRTFCDVTNTPMYRTRYPDKWPNYLRCMSQGYSLQKSAELVGISLSTSFEWRHKILLGVV